jgi:hypothetical protein
LGEGEPYCKNVTIAGCPYSLCNNGAQPVPIDESGNNCYDAGNGQISCWVKPVAAEPATPCPPEGCPPTEPVPEPIEEPKQVHDPETATQTEQDQETGGTTQTDVEVKREVQPNGTTTETETKTTTKTEGGQTTKIIETKVTTRNPDGSTTTTNTTQKTNPDGSTETTASGSSSKPGGETKNPEKEEEGAASGEASGNCDTPPSCKGDANLCAILRQQWEMMCYGSDYELDGDFYEKVEGDPKDRLQQAVTDFQNRLKEGSIVTAIDNFFTWNGGGSCPSYTFDSYDLYFTFDQWCSSEIPWDLVRGIVMAVALLLAARIAFT